MSRLQRLRLSGKTFNVLCVLLAADSPHAAAASSASRPPRCHKHTGSVKVQGPGEEPGRWFCSPSCSHVFLTASSQVNVTLSPNHKIIFMENQAAFKCEVSGRDETTVRDAQISWTMDGRDVTNESTTGPVQSESGLYKKTSSVTRTLSQWRGDRKLSCSAETGGATPTTKDLTVHTGGSYQHQHVTHVSPEPP